MRYRQPLVFSSTLSTILLLLKLTDDLGLALQPNPSAHSSSLLPRGHVSSDGPTRRFLGSVDVDEKTELEGEKQTISTYDWDEQFEKLQSFKSEYGHCNFPQKASLALTRKYPTLSRFCDDQRLDYQLHRRRQVKRESNRMTLAVFDRDIRMRRLEEIGFALDRKAAGWYEFYCELVEFHSANGNCLVKQADNKPLCNWGNWQRVNHREGSLSETQIDLLNRIGFPWEGYFSFEWMHMYNELAEFHRKHGHFRVARDDNPSLLYWIHNQRNKINLSKEQRKLLDDINFPWEPDFFDSAWSTKYNELVDFKKKHGDLMVEYDSDLDRWMNHLRRRFSRKRGFSPLSAEQVQLLDDIEFPWKSPRLDAKWMKKYNDLARFREKQGHCKPRYSKQRKLYGWSASQRKKNAQGLLSAEQIDLLDKIDFPWEQNNEKTYWKSMYNQLCSFVNRHGHLRRVSREDDPDLYEWMELQRQQYHGMVEPTALSDYRIERLDELHFRWSLDWRERTWHEKYAEAVEFFKEHGHVVVNEKENPSLYNWIETQEKRYKEVEGQKPLSGEELELLEQIDFPFFDGQPRMTWSAMYAKVERFREENNGRFPTSHKDDPNLSLWMRQQRHRYRQAYGYAPLSDEQETLLESIDFPRYPEAKQLRKWYEKYDEVVDFKKQHGNFLVDRNKDSPALFVWICNQRKRYHGKSPHHRPLSKMQLYLLEHNIEFAWTSNFDKVQWEKNYEELVGFWKTRGRFPNAYLEHPKLYKWIRVQRTRRKPDKTTHTYDPLSEHQIQQLDKIGFPWSIYNK